MKNLVILLLLLITANHRAQQSSNNATDTLPIPKVQIENWDKYYMPVDKFKEGIKLIASYEGNLKCKVISYILAATIEGYSEEVRVKSDKIEGKALKLYEKVGFGNKFYIENIQVKFENGVIKKANPLKFWKTKKITIDNATDTLPVPRVRIENWNKPYMPIDEFKEGTKLIASCYGNLKCKVVSYVFSCSINNLTHQKDEKSDKIEHEPFKLYESLRIGDEFAIQQIKVQFENGVIKSANDLRFTKTDKRLIHFMKSAIDDNPLTEDFGVFKSNIRIKLEGSVDSTDYKIVNEIIEEINPLLKTTSIKIVDTSPTFVIDFQLWDGYWSNCKVITDTILHPLFPNTIKKHIVLNIPTRKSTWAAKLSRKAIIGTAIIWNLAHFNKSYTSYWENTMISGKGEVPDDYKLTEYDKELIKMLYSKKGQSELKRFKNIKEVKIADNTLLLFVLSFLLFITFSGIISHFHAFNISIFIKSKFVVKLISSLLIIQIPICLILLFSSNEERSLQLFISYELGFALIALVVTVCLSGIDALIKNIKINGLDLIIDFILISLSFLLSYQILYLFILPELLPVRNIDIQLVLIPTSVAAFRFYLRYSQRRMSAILREKELEISKQKEITLKSELSALQSRINPHFLYNALNSIASLTYIDAEKTEKMTLALARLFRYNINKSSETFSTIQQEIEIVKIYLDVEMVRFSDRLTYSVKVDDKLLDYKIPIFLLQPLVENAIKHGISKLKDKGVIRIDIHTDDTWLIIDVHDNGPVFPDNMMINYGLQSVFDKLSLLYGKEYEIKFINSPQKRITIKIKK